ncbi:hypothetical protein K1719_009208 [Acacia pycnantha]|nr:hypothetical protein K1719_009208 [Acacia pycnantha]
MGYNAADIVKRIPRDSKSFVIRKILDEDGSDGPTKWSWSHVSKSIDKWLVYKSNWVEEMRGNLSLVATVLATISFQAATNPPGSVIQQGITPSDPNFNLNTSNDTSLSQGHLGSLNYKDGSLNYKDDNGDIGSNLRSCPG